VLIDRALKADPSQEKAKALSAKVAAMAEAELLGHFKVEEEILFPAVRGALDSGAVVDELIAQHREMEKLIENIARASDKQRIPLLQEFGDLLSRHIRIEERQLFQEIQAKLAAEDLGKLGQEIDAQVKKVCPVTDRLPWDNS
jgi:hemerythrin-like domain-containing protein